MFEIKLDKQAENFLKKIEKSLFNRILVKIKELQLNPVPHNAKRLIGYEASTFRIRVGDYRALYRISYDTKLIVIVKIDKRSHAYD